MLAHIADIPQLKKAFADGLDIHAMTASEMFGVPVKDMPAEVRRRAKAINFGIIYGISAFGLAAQLGITKQEAGEYIKTYFKRFPGIRDYMERTKKFAHDHGYVETVFGRRVHYPEINTRNPSMRGFLERAGDQRADPGLGRRHHPPRHDPHAGSARRRPKLGATTMLLQVHDELIFEAKEAEVDRGHPDRAPRHGESARAGREVLSPDPRRCQSRRQLGSRALSWGVPQSWTSLANHVS